MKKVIISPSLLAEYLQGSVPRTKLLELMVRAGIVNLKNTEMCEQLKIPHDKCIEIIKKTPRKPLDPADIVGFIRGYNIDPSIVRIFTLNSVDINTFALMVIWFKVKIYLKAITRTEGV